MNLFSHPFNQSSMLSPTGHYYQKGPENKSEEIIILLYSKELQKF